MKLACNGGPFHGRLVDVKENVRDGETLLVPDVADPKVQGPVLPGERHAIQSNQTYLVKEHRRATRTGHVATFFLIYVEPFI